MKECYFLSVAGCLLYFQIDYIFEENGQDKFYQLVIFLSPTPSLSFLSIIFLFIKNEKKCLLIRI
jgi:hypothetical protein